MTGLVIASPRHVCPGSCPNPLCVRLLELETRSIPQQQRRRRRKAGRKWSAWQDEPAEGPRRFQLIASRRFRVFQPIQGRTDLRQASAFDGGGAVCTLAAAAAAAADRRRIASSTVIADWPRACRTQHHPPPECQPIWRADHDLRDSCTYDCLESQAVDFRLLHLSP